MSARKPTRQIPCDMHEPHVVERFWSKIAIGAADECWPWLGAKYPGGYGRFAVKKVGWRATHVVLAYNGVAVPPDGFACHSCDNPNCCNPAHLWIGNHTANMRDKIAKGRCWRARGRLNGHARLTEEAVRYIRSNATPYRKLAVEFGVSARAIRDARSGKNWSWLT